MKIVIIGAGKVGEELCCRLAQDDHDVVLIEQNSRRLEQLINMADITGVSGNGAVYRTQMEAGVDKCDIFIAVSPHDETNIIAAITAKKLGAKHTIARARDPEYSEQMEFVRDSLGINLMINPEMEAARDIARIIHFRSVLGIEQFDNGRVNIVEVLVAEGSRLSGRTLKELREIGQDFLVCAIQRGDEVIIPNGDATILAGDRIHITGTLDVLNKMYIAAGSFRQRLDTVLIVGGGRLTHYLLPLLLRLKMQIKVIEVDPERADALAETFPGVEVVCGDGTDQAFLQEERIANFDVVVSLTGIDEENILLSLFAANQGVKRVITKVNRTDLLKVLDGVNLGSTITPRHLIANVISRFVRALQNSQGSNVEALYRIVDNKVEALMFKIKSDSKVVRIPLMELKVRDNLLFAFIVRKGKLIFPQGKDAILPEDRVAVVTTHHNFQDIDDILEPRGNEPKP